MLHVIDYRNRKNLIILIIMLRKMLKFFIWSLN